MTQLPKPGEVVYEEGNPVCHICGKSFSRLMNHVRQKHNMSADEYRRVFCLKPGKSIMSEESRQKSRIAVQERPEIIKALNVNGKNSRFKKGHKRGRETALLNMRKTMLTRSKPTLLLGD